MGQSARHKRERFARADGSFSYPGPNSPQRDDPDARVALYGRLERGPKSENGRTLRFHMSRVEAQRFARAIGEAFGLEEER